MPRVSSQLRNRSLCLIALSIVCAVSDVVGQKTLSFSVSGTPLEFVWVPVEGSDGFKQVEIGDFDRGRPKEKKRLASIYAPFERSGLRGYYLGKMEVTQEQWAAVMGEGDRAKLPATGKTYSEVQIFLEKINRFMRESGEVPSTPDGAQGLVKLPTEAEWEYAARGGEWSGYRGGDPYGGDLERYEVFSLPGSDGKAKEVGSRPPNRLGLHDMLGNVRELMEGNYSVDGVAGGGLLLKGGSYLSEKGELRSSSRTEHQRTGKDGEPTRRSDAGLRLAISAEIVTSLGSELPDSSKPSVVSQDASFGTPEVSPSEPLNKAKPATAPQSMPVVGRGEDGTTVITFPTGQSFYLPPGKGLLGPSSNPSSQIPFVNEAGWLVAVNEQPATKSSLIHIYVKGADGLFTEIKNFNARVANAAATARLNPFFLRVEGVSGDALELESTDFDSYESRWAIRLRTDGSIGSISEISSTTSVEGLIPSSAIRSPTQPGPRELPAEGADPASQFAASYQDFKRAEKLASEGHRDDAVVLFRGVGFRLAELSRNFPKWQPLVVQFRMEATRRALDSLSKSPLAEAEEPKIERPATGPSDQNLNGGEYSDQSKSSTKPTTPALATDSGIDVFNTAREIRFPNGYAIYNDAGAIVKKVPGPASVSCKLFAANKPFAPDGAYLSDWSYDRLRKGEKPNWVVGDAVGAPLTNQSSIADEPDSREATSPAPNERAAPQEKAKTPRQGPTFPAAAQFVPDMVVSSDYSQFFQLGPTQAGGADLSLRRGDRIMLLRKEFGFSRVQLPSGQTGFMANEDLMPAPTPSAPAQPTPGPNSPAPRRYLAVDTHWRSLAPGVWVGAQANPSGDTQVHVFDTVTRLVLKRSQVPQSDNCSQDSFGNAVYNFSGRANVGDALTCGQFQALYVGPFSALEKYPAPGAVANVPQQSESPDSQRPVVYEGPFYRPADKFPKNVRGIKLVGSFVATGLVDANLSTLNGRTYYKPPFWLKADRKAGEKHLFGRAFYPQNKSIQPGETFVFTEESPLTIIEKKSSLGDYLVAFPEN